MTVTSLSEDTDNYKDTVGTYNIVLDKTHDDRPVFKKEHNMNAKYIFYSCK